MMKKLFQSKGWFIAVVATLMIGLPAIGAGFLTNGLPVAGGTQYPTTLPLTGNERLPADTQLTQGLNPASEAISIGQIAAYGQITGTVTTAANTTSFTATTAQILPTSMNAPSVFFTLTGTLAGAGTVTTPTAAQIFAALPSGAALGQAYLLKIANESSGAFAWTLAGGTGVTLTGSGVIPQYGSRNFLVTFTSATAVAVQDLGN